MGFNHAAVGYPAVADFVTAMRSGAGVHMGAFVAFICVNGLAPRWRPQ